MSFLMLLRRSSCFSKSGNNNNNAFNIICNSSSKIITKIVVILFIVIVFVFGSYGVDVSTERVSFNGNMLSVATCGDCEEELGYYLVEVRTFVYMKWEPNTFCVKR